MPKQGKEKKSHTEHWEMKYRDVEGNDNKSGIRAFDPRISKDRPCTHKKINELDH